MRPTRYNPFCQRTQFQSTHPHGVRPEHFEEGKAFPVSIHAPARGATRITSVLLLPSMFQSTHPHGVRHLTSTTRYPAPSFNPRTRTGCDQIISRSGRRLVCFNPRTRTGCDLTAQTSMADLLSFNPRTRTGCDNPPIENLPVADCFNPRTRTGCD